MVSDLRVSMLVLMIYRFICFDNFGIYTYLMIVWLNICYWSILAENSYKFNF